MSAIRLTRLCLPRMRSRGWGRVIVSTSYSVKQPIPNLMLSNAVRSATTAWAKTLADEVGPHGITVNTIAPGRIETERIRQLDGVIAEQSQRPLEDVVRQSRTEPAFHSAAMAVPRSSAAAPRRLSRLGAGQLHQWRHPARRRRSISGDVLMRLASRLGYGDGFLQVAERAVRLEEAGLEQFWVGEAYSFDAATRLGYLAARTHA